MAELDDRSGSANLHKIIHMVRRAFEPKLRSGGRSQFIVTRDQQVQLTSYAVSGRRTEALSAIEKIKRLSKVTYASDYCQALVRTGLGDRARAIAHLEGAFEERYDRMIYLNVEL